MRFGYYLWMLFLVCVFIGWLKIPETDIDYPVMQTVADEDYYIRILIKNTVGPECYLPMRLRM